MAGILAATISSSDSYLLIAASAFAKNIYQGLLRKKASDREVLNISRITLLLIAVVAIIIALDENSVIFTIVSFAWAGFGATFGPLMLFSLFWKRTTRAGAIAGMLGGAGMVFVWNLLVRPLAACGISMTLPAFLFSCLCIVVVSLLTPQPSEQIQREFEDVKQDSRIEDSSFCGHTEKAWLLIESRYWTQSSDRAILKTERDSDEKRVNALPERSLFFICGIAEEMNSYEQNIGSVFFSGRNDQKSGRIPGSGGRSRSV